MGCSDEKGQPSQCINIMQCIGVACMRGVVFSLVWGTSLRFFCGVFFLLRRRVPPHVCSNSACIWVITPACGGAGLLAMVSVGFLLWAAIQCTRFYLLTCHTDPGGLPRDEWVPSDEELLFIQSVIGQVKSWAEIKATKQIAWCRHCERHRPLRSHHCRDCERCVLRQDHHCPWVTTCVGYHNQKYFVLFMLYAVTGLLSVLFWVLVRVIQLFQHGSLGGDVDSNAAPLPASVIIATMIDGILSLALVLAISMLLCYQLWCLWRNTSTIEHYDYSRRQDYANRNGIPFLYPYDHGWRQNLKHFFGRNLWDSLSAIPTAGDGYHESISPKFLSSLRKGVVHWHLDIEDANRHESKDGLI